MGRIINNTTYHRLQKLLPVVFNTFDTYIIIIYQRGFGRMFCNKCGTELNPGDKFCGNCGAPVVIITKTEAGRAASQGPAPMSRKKKLMNIAFIILAVCIILGYYAYYIHKAVTLTKETVDKAFEQYQYQLDDWEDMEEEYEVEEDLPEEDIDTPEIEYVHVDAPEYTGRYDYFNDEKWIVDVQGLFVNQEGDSNDKLLGIDHSGNSSRDLKETMVLTEDGQFYYVNANTDVIEFAQGTTCAELAFDGGTMFYVIPEKKEGESEEFEVGTLFLFDTATGFSDSVAENVQANSPVISPDGNIVAYTRIVDSKNSVLCIAGSDMEEKQIQKGNLRACSVDNSGNLFYTNEEQNEIYRYKDGKSEKVLSSEEFNNYFINGSADEILISCSAGAYFCDGEMEEAAQVYEGGLVTNMHTSALHQSYGQFRASILDVASLKDLYFISKEGVVFIITSDGRSAAFLDHNYNDVDNIVFDDVNRELMYCCDGVLYKSKVSDDGIEDEAFYEEDDVETFFASYDLKNVWLKIRDDIYYLKDGELENVIPDYVYDDENTGLYFAWNIEDNKLYFTEYNTLYSVYDTEGSTEKVADDVDALFKINGKLGFLDLEGNIYLYINNEFVCVY